jgi:uncharacterized protein YgiM (DUF1202 family)
MRRIIPIAVLAVAIAAAGGARAENPAAPSGNVGTNVGNSMDQPMVVATDNGNVREQPNAQAKLLTTVPRGQKVTMIGTANGGAWAHVLVNGLDGYIDLVQLEKAPAESVSTSAPGQFAPRYMAVISDSANVRQRPTNESQLLATLPRGSRVTVIGSDGGWAHIQGNGVDGYAEYAQLADAAPPYGMTTYQPPYQANYQTYTPSQSYQAYPTTPYYQTSPTYQYGSNAPAYQYPYNGQAYPYEPNGQGYPYASNGQVYPYQPYAPATRVVNGGGGTVHRSPDPQSPLVGTLPPGYQVPVLGLANGNWAHVVANGVDGYMNTDQLQ